MSTYRKPIPIETSELCKYGCGNLAKFQTPGGHLICESASTKCPTNRAKNSISLTQTYNSGKRKSSKEVYSELPDAIKDKMAWSRNKTLKPLDNFFYNGSPTSTGHLKQIILRHQLLTYKCCKCGCGEMWQGNPIQLELDHINGQNDDSRLENLRFLCPNCHSQTDTFRGRNIVNKNISEEEFVISLTKCKSIRQCLIDLKLSPKGANYVRAYKIALKHNIQHLIDGVGGGIRTHNPEGNGF